MEKSLRFILLIFAFNLCIFLVGCYNRFQEYQPYSTYDEKMADARLNSYTAQEYYSTNQDYYDNYSEYDDYFAPPPPPGRNGNRVTHQPYQQRRFSSPRPPSHPPSRPAKHSNTEVPFTETRSPKKEAANIGAL